MAAKENVIVVLTTGTGKTRIAIEVINTRAASVNKTPV